MLPLGTITCALSSLITFMDLSRVLLQMAKDNARESREFYGFDADHEDRIKYSTYFLAILLFYVKNSFAEDDKSIFSISSKSGREAGTARSG